MISKDQLIVILVGFIVIVGAFSTLQYYQFTHQIVTLSTTGPRVYKVTFQQSGTACPGSGPYYVHVWAVTLGNKTEVEPSTTSFPFDNGNGVQLGGSYSPIVFSVPNGNYQVKAYPDFFSNASRTVRVNASDITLTFMVAGISCSATVSTTPQRSATT